MAHIDYYMFTLSPFTYLAGNKLEEIASSYGATRPRPSKRSAFLQDQTTPFGQSVKPPFSRAPTP